MKIAFSIIMILHGLAHLSGFLATWTNLDVGFQDRNMIFSGKHYLRGYSGKIFGVFWFISMVLLVFSGVALLIGLLWWYEVLLIGVISSLVSIIPGLKCVPPGAKLGAIFDLIVLIILLTPLKSQILQFV
jgi:hypothetical protein